MALPVAVQLYSVRDEMAADFAGTLRQIKEMGYDGVEFAGLFGHSPEYIKGLLEGLGLVPVSAHVAIDEMLVDPEKTFSDYETIGCKYVAVPYMNPDRRPGAENFEKSVKEIAMLGDIAKKHGIQLLYHNHDFEFKKLDNGEYGIDYLYRMTSPEQLQTEFDTCWINVAGENPSNFVLKYTGRAPVVHLKDFFMSGKLPTHLYALIGIKDEPKEDEPSTFEFRPLGHGMQDMPALLDASVKAGAEWVVVEQDENTLSLSRLESVMVSRQYLRTLGW